jgi:hypothetical protein
LRSQVHSCRLLCKPKRHEARVEFRNNARCEPSREVFAKKLREPGIDAEATRQAARGQTRNHEPLWRLKAQEDGRLRSHRAHVKSSVKVGAKRNAAAESWLRLGRALAVSSDRADRDLARSIATFVREMPGTRSFGETRRDTEVALPRTAIDLGPTR